MHEIACHTDPLCPWAWLTSRWLARLEELGEVRVEWRLFSLGIANQPEGESADGPVGRSGRALELLALARRDGGNEAIGRLYRELGLAAHVRGQSLAEQGTLAEALSLAGMDPGPASEPSLDPSLWQEVVADHQRAVAHCQAFGVPTLILDGGSGPGFFGPVITEVPDDHEAKELLQDVTRLASRPYVFELKRDREGHPPQLNRSVA